MVLDNSPQRLPICPCHPSDRDRPLEKQHKIAERYLAKEDEIKVLKLKLQKAKNDIRTIFDEEVE